MKYGVGDFRLTENLWMVIAKPVGRFSVVIIGVLSVIKHLKMDSYPNGVKNENRTELSEENGPRYTYRDPKIQASLT